MKYQGVHFRLTGPYYNMALLWSYLNVLSENSKSWTLADGSYCWLVCELTVHLSCDLLYGLESAVNLCKTLVYMIGEWLWTKTFSEFMREGNLKKIQNWDERSFPGKQN
jgi:hypothetical protein